MRVKKIGHCCIVIEIDNKRILFDPGAFSTGQEEERDICAVIITHEHEDHFHIGSLKKILAANPQAIVVTNQSVGKLLEENGIHYIKVEDSQSENVNGILIEGFGTVHALIYDLIPPVANTGYFIDNKFFFPGDAFYNPGKQVEVLALPVEGPWMKLSEALDYLKLVKPVNCFNVHDGQITPERATLLHKLPKDVSSQLGINFTYLGEGESVEF
jgi:L-ascorbate metabolism protein UlaG (beta-lactamase superfamily)